MKKRWMVIEDARYNGPAPFEVYHDKGFVFRDWYYMQSFPTLAEAEEYIDSLKDSEFYRTYPVRLRK